jgi:hypothetical protein
MTDSSRPEAIWVSVVEAARITGYNRGHVLRLARENGRLPEAERAFRLRILNRAYEIWLPDLLVYIEKRGRGPATKPELDEMTAEEIWVTTIEAAQFLGYHTEHIRRIVNKITKLQEDSREVKVRRRSFGYEIWLPDLLDYLKKRRANWLKKEA